MRASPTVSLRRAGAPLVGLAREFVSPPFEPTARMLVGIAVALMTVGLLMVYSASCPGAEEALGDAELYLRRQAVWCGVGLLTMWGAMRLDLRTVERAAWPLLAVALVLLAAVVVPEIGHDVKGARRWLRLGPLSFQPSELAKLAIVVWLAAHLGREGRRLGEWRRGVLPAAVPLGLACGLVLLEPDFGTALFLGAVGVAVMLVGGVPVSRLLVLGLCAAPVIAWHVVERWELVVRRFGVMQGDAADPTAIYQVQQGLIALGSGGLTGRGVGAGRQKLFYLPEAPTDFILPVVGEELGFVGTATVLLLFVAFVLCGLRICMGAARREAFGFLLTFGLVFWVGLQAAGNVAVVTGSVPTKGIALPFISLGGSSLLLLSAAVGLVYGVARHLDAAPAPEPRP
jgi:cell division protein FtsW